MAVLGTSQDPNYYHNQAARTGEALGMILARLEQRREQKKQEELQQIDRFFKVAENYPEVAATWGQDIKRKYGNKHPGVNEMVDVLQHRYTLADAMKQRQEVAKNSWLQNWDALNADYGQQTQQAAQMPEQAAVPFPDAGGWGPYPNYAKDEAEAALKKTDPRYFSRKALEQLPPELQVAASDFLKTGTAFELPPAATIFDPYKNLPTEQQALHAGLTGQTSPEQLEAARVKLGMKKSPSRAEFEKFQVEDREDRQAFDEAASEADRSWRDTDRDTRYRQSRERIGYQDALARAREARRVGNEKGLIDYRASKKVGEGDSVDWDSLVKDSKSAQKDWDVRLKQSLQGIRDAKKRQAARAEFEKQAGPRPQMLSETQARRMARELNMRVKEGDLTLDEAEDEALEMTSDIMSGDSFPAARAANRQRTMQSKVSQTRGEVRAEIENMHPDWTTDQVDDAVNNYLWSLAEGEQ